MPTCAVIPPAGLLNAFAEGDALAGSAIADFCAERGEDALAAGWRWVAKARRLPRRCIVSDEPGVHFPGGRWYWTSDGPTSPEHVWKISRELLKRLVPPLKSPAHYADYPTPALALSDLARAAGALIAEGGKP